MHSIAEWSGRGRVLLVTFVVVALIGVNGMGAQAENDDAVEPDPKPTSQAAPEEVDKSEADSDSDDEVTVEGAQELDPQDTPWWVAEGRACDGCPWRRSGHAILQTTFVNFIYGVANLIRGQDTAKVTPATWWGNMKHGWVWDLDDFTYKISIDSKIFWGSVWGSTGAFHSPAPH